MKANATVTRSEGPEQRPPPCVHDTTEPEYDVHVVEQRASKVTSVLEQILREHPSPMEKLPPPPTSPPAPPA